jgi:DNA-binding transcriptional regulator LsrR (DeoR family)
VRAVAAKADLRLVGVGQMDGRRRSTLTASCRARNCLEMMRLGAVGELTGWALTIRGHIIRRTNLPDQHSAAGSPRP